MSQEIAKINTSQATMSSREIAALCNKLHKNVTTDIEKMLTEVGIDGLKFQRIYKDKLNRDQREFLLPRRECDLVISGYSVKYRLAIIDRWHELEALTPKVSYADSLRILADTIEAKEKAEQACLEAVRTKAEIGSRREASAMNTASIAVKKAKKLEIELDQSQQYCTVKRMQMIHHGQKFNWRLLKSTAIEMGIPTREVFDANYGKVKSYHVDVWQEAYAVGIEGAAA